MAYLDRFEVHDQNQIAQIRDRFLNLNSPKERVSFFSSRPGRFLSVAVVSTGIYGALVLSSREPVCTSGTLVKVTNPSSSAALLRDSFTSSGCEMANGTKMVILSKATGEKYAAPKKDVQPITQ